MTKAKISQYDPSASNNTDVNGVNIAEGCAPSGINDAIREVMAALKRFETGSDGDSITVGGNLVVSGSTTISGSAVIGGSATISNSATLSKIISASINAGSAATPTIHAVGDTDTGIFFPAANTIAFTEGGAEAMRIDSDGDVGIGTSNPTFKLEVSGSIGVSGNPAYLLKAITYLTTGTAATYTTPTGVRALYVECVGGGGGSGGVDGQGSGTGAVSGPGAGGGYTAKLITSPSASYTYTIGSGGAGGASGDNNGTTGGTTTFTDGTLTLTATGGTFGDGDIGTSGGARIVGNAGGTGSGGDINIEGQSPAVAVVSGGDIVSMGNSGFCTIFGCGIVGRTAVSTGSAGPNGVNHGDGGGSAYAENITTNFAGGAGKAGVIRITEYY